MSKVISYETLVESFPESLRQDEDLYFLAQVVALQLFALWRDNDKIGVFNRIDDLDESMLDILAGDLNVFWYVYDAPVEYKREQIKKLFATYKYLGTRKATEDALSGICDELKFSEWYEYGGSPGYFRIEFEAKESITPEIVLKTLEKVKRESAIMEKMSLRNTGKMPHYVGMEPVFECRSQQSMAMDVDMPTILTDDGLILVDGDAILTL